MACGTYAVANGVCLLPYLIVTRRFGARIRAENVNCWNSIGRCGRRVTKRIGYFRTNPNFRRDDQDRMLNNPDPPPCGLINYYVTTTALGSFLRQFSGANNISEINGVSRLVIYPASEGFILKTITYELRCLIKK